MVEKKHKYIHDELCHSVIEGEECSCYVRRLVEKDEQIASLKAENKAYERFAEDVGRANVLASTYGYLARNISEAQQRLAHALLKEHE
jgi:hypothetical protein